VVNAARAVNDALLLGGIEDCACACYACSVGQCVSCGGTPPCRRAFLLARQPLARDAKKRGFFRRLADNVADSLVRR